MREAMRLRPASAIPITRIAAVPGADIDHRIDGD
jgi:hypothetical protein